MDQGLEVYRRASRVRQRVGTKLVALVKDSHHGSKIACQWIRKTVYLERPERVGELKVRARAGCRKLSLRPR